MKNYLKMGMFLLAVSLYSCGGSEGETTKNETIERPNPNNPNNSATVEPNDNTSDAELPPSERTDLSTKGVGPVTSVDIDLAGPIDEALAARGKEIYDVNCTACHTPEKRLVGPAQKGILERRTPEWIMNMILDPEGMVQNDPLAKELLIEFNGAPMSNQGITEEEARAMLEYFRTL